MICIDQLLYASCSRLLANWTASKERMRVARERARRAGRPALMDFGHRILLAHVQSVDLEKLTEALNLGEA
jgi:hypothetical protein